MKRYFVSFICHDSFGNAILDVPSAVQTWEHILALQKMVSDKIKVEATDIAIINFILIQPE